MGETGVRNGRSVPVTGWSALGIVSAYVAAIVAFAYAAMSLYWAVGGRALVGTVGGYVEQFASRGGALPVLAALAVTAAKVAGGLLALALVRPWGRVVSGGWLLLGSESNRSSAVTWQLARLARGCICDDEHRDGEEEG